jgi:hypothetical protein
MYFCAVVLDIPGFLLVLLSIWPLNDQPHTSFIILAPGDSLFPFLGIPLIQNMKPPDNAIGDCCRVPGTLLLHNNTPDHQERSRKIRGIEKCSYLNPIMGTLNI